MKPLVLGIAGASGSGKSTFSEILLKELTEYKVVTIRTDNYFKAKLPKIISPVSQNEYDDYNHPESVDYKKIITDLNNFILKEYDIIIIEGIMIFYFEEIRRLLDLKIFIELDSDERMYRRIKRNMSLWGLKMKEIADYYLEAAKHREREYIIWTKMFADIIINGNNFEPIPLEVITSWIRNRTIKR
ncbi:AAA family ATPase [Clostridium swellfunianum]|uniref:uridine kinase family protein n=1 Tax=Clostridium swellfunianum TaxID=1367462 RepID=UPI0020304C1F|nr:AAA family ATPase [Clostridium swellfunianum]MCM0648659.1 AAA family ATPase [Clostridium swellfunianum]